MSEANPPIDTVVVGAGSAGVAVSRCLQRAKIAHVVLERDSVGASWRTRWNSFHLNTINALNVLPDGEPTHEPEGFLSRDEWVAAMDAYATENRLPIRTGVTVSSIRPVEDGFETKANGEVIRSKHVVLCTGDQNVPRVPGLSASLPEDITQMHSRDYREPSELPEGAVLVVGSGQSGVQIAEDLLEAGRSVWVCSSRVGRVPRRYRGRDILGWVQMIGMMNQPATEVPEEERGARQAIISGTRGGHSLSLQGLGNEGAKVLGRLVGVEGRTLRIGDDLRANVAFADEACAKLRGGLDMFIDKAGVDAPAPQPDPADVPWDGLEAMAEVRHVDLDESGIRTVIWATGFGGDFDYLPAELLDERGLPAHTDGVCAPGLYCVGLMMQRTRGSGLIPGAAADAEVVAKLIAGE